MAVGDDEGVSRNGHDVRAFLSEALGQTYGSFRTLDEARAGDGAVVLSGDYGGTIFVTAPARIVACSEEALITLVSDLDAITWMSGDLTIATVAFEAYAIGSGVVGGDGGEVIIDGVWVHPHQIPSEVAAQAREVVLGLRTRIDLGLLRQERERELAKSVLGARPIRSSRRICATWAGISTFSNLWYRFSRANGLLALSSVATQAVPPRAAPGSPPSWPGCPARGRRNALNNTLVLQSEKPVLDGLQAKGLGLTPAIVQDLRC